MGDPAAGARSDRGLAGSLAGGIDGLLAVHDAIAADLHGYACFLLRAGRHAADDGPAEAVLDALLVAAGTIGELADPGRTRAWLYALTRNECLRQVSHRPADRPLAAAEAAELAGRHGLAPAEIGAVLGQAVRPVADPEPPAPVKAPPGWLRGELATAIGVEGAGRRAELARRAHPYDPDGFPVPVDHRRLSARALAWSAAAVVLTALGLLVLLPTGGGPNGALPGPARAAALPGPAAAGSGAAPVPTLPATAFVDRPPATSAAPRPQPAPDRGADRRSAATTPASAPAARAGTDSGDGEGRRWPRTALLVTWRPEDGKCGGAWTAELRVRAYGADVAAIAQVTASVSAVATVPLSRDGSGWVGELAGLPGGEQVAVTVRAVAADGSTVRSVSRRLTDPC